MNSDTPQRRTRSTDHPVARADRGSSPQRTVVIVTNTCLAGVGTLYLTTGSFSVVIAGCCLAVLVVALTLTVTAKAGRRR